MMKRVRVFPLSSASYASQVYTGLTELASMGKIELELIWAPRIRIHEKNGRRVIKDNKHLVYLEVEDANDSLCTICYDLSDGPNIVSLDGLQHCDVYFKRSYLPFAVRRLRWKEKIHPFGLNFPSRSQSDSQSLRRTLIHHTATGAWKKDLASSTRTVAKALLQSVLPGGLRLEDHRMPSEDLEYGPDEPSEPLILFQTRLFDPTVSVEPDLVVELNDFRAETMRALKSAFGDRLVGGLIPNEYTRRVYPEYLDLLTTESTDRVEYLRLVKDCLIAIFTRGLANSNGWRLPEFLATSRCIVSQRLIYELPDSLTDGENCLYFDSPDECVEACERLLHDPELVQLMRRANFDYYHQNVKPAAIVWNSLETANRVVARSKNISRHEA